MDRVYSNDFNVIIRTVMDRSQRFTPVLFLQLTMLFVDLCINAAAPLVYFHNTVQLMLYVIQDTCTVMALIIMFLTFFSTYVFQAGLVSVLISRFQTTIYSSVIYLAFSIAYHVWSLRLRWQHEYDYIWTPGLTAIFVIQRTATVLYYYFYKRTALMLADPRYHMDTPWLRSQIEKRR